MLKQGAVEFNPLLCSCSAPQRELSCWGARALVSLSYMRPLIRTFQQAHRFIYMTAISQSWYPILRENWACVSSRAPFRRFGHPASPRIAFGNWKPWGKGLKQSPSHQSLQLPFLNIIGVKWCVFKMFQVNHIWFAVSCLMEGQWMAGAWRQNAKHPDSNARAKFQWLELQRSSRALRTAVRKKTHSVFQGCALKCCCHHDSRCAASWR